MSRVHVLLLIAGGAVATSASAHHGIANFDLNKDIAINGTVSKLAFVNPHSWLYVNVVGPDGKSAEWQCEMRAATVLRRSGWSEAMFTPGTSVAITGSRTASSRIPVTWAPSRSPMERAWIVTANDRRQPSQ